MAAVFGFLKDSTSYLTSCVAESVYSTQPKFLPRLPGLERPPEEATRANFATLTEEQKGTVYHKIWELAKMRDASISGANWGEIHVMEDIPRLSEALYRLGLFHAPDDPAVPIACLPASFGEGGIGSQYFSLTERRMRNHEPGHVGCVNGMGVPSLAHAGRDAAGLSDRFIDGNDLHCVYNATHQNAPSGDLLGFITDVTRMKAIDGGSYGYTSYLIAQQWVDYLDQNPGKNYLQMAHSEGAAHTNAALRIIHAQRPELLARIRVICFCPAHFIVPETYGNGLQVINLFKHEDGVINPWAAGTHRAGDSEHIIAVQHTGDHPHNHISDDYMRIGKPYCDAFMRSGNIY